MTPVTAIWAPTIRGRSAICACRHAEGHGDANLAALGFHHARGQIEGGKDRADEYSERNDVRRLLIALDVFRDGAVDRVIDVLRDVNSNQEQLVAQRLLKLGDDRFPGGIITDADDGLIDETGPRCDVLHGLQRRKDNHVAGMGEESAALCDNDKVLRRQRVPDVADCATTGNERLALGGQVMGKGEFVLKENIEPAGIGRAKFPALGQVDAVDGYSLRVRKIHADQLTGDKDDYFVVFLIHCHELELRRDGQAFLHALDCIGGRDGLNDPGELVPWNEAAVA